MIPEHDQKRFWRLVDKTDSCWLWTGGTASGYGCFQVKFKNYRSHRLAYELLRSPIPNGLHLDHLCRVRNCVNPDHLEPVTQKENNRRSEAICAKVVREGVCSRGHSMDDAHVHPKTGKRWCRTCRYEAYRRRRVLTHPGSKPNPKIVETKKRQRLEARNG